MRGWIIVALLSVALVGCGKSPGPDVTLTPPAHIADMPDSVAMKGCTWPLLVKVKTMTKAELETLLRTNAQNQIDCTYRHDILRHYVTNLINGLDAVSASKS